MLRGAAFFARLGLRALLLARSQSVGRAVGRWLVKWFAGWFGGSLISMGMIGGLPNHKAIHDYTAGTIVLRGRPDEDRPIEPWRIMAAFGITFAWLLGTFYTIL